MLLTQSLLNVFFFSVKLTPMGSRPLETIMDSRESESEPIASPESQADAGKDKDVPRAENPASDKKTKKKEYKKNAITNKSDFKIRKELDEADNMLEKVYNSLLLNCLIFMNGLIYCYINLFCMLKLGTLHCFSRGVGQGLSNVEDYNLYDKIN